MLFKKICDNYAKNSSDFGWHFILFVILPLLAVLLWVTDLSREESDPYVGVEDCILIDPSNYGSGTKNFIIRGQGFTSKRFGEAKFVSLRAKEETPPRTFLLIGGTKTVYKGTAIFVKTEADGKRFFCEILPDGR